jgi:hypothetical protein
MELGDDLAERRTPEKIFHGPVAAWNVNVDGVVPAGTSGCMFYRHRPRQLSLDGVNVAAQVGGLAVTA